jgi:cytochrome P450
MGVSQGKRLPSLFSTTDESYHANLRRSVNAAFSMSTLVQYEPFVNDATEIFLDQTEKLFARPNKVCDFAEWLQYYAFDVIGQLTYSKRHGFVERAEDVDGMVGYLGKLFSYVAPVGQMPWLDLLFLKNPIVLWMDKLGFTLFKFPITTFAKAHMDERLAEIESNKALGIDESSGRADLLSMFLKAKKDRPDFMTDQRVLTMAVSMAFAGSETTAISLAATFYYLLRNPTTYKTLVDELDAAVRDGKIENRPNGLVSWSESQDLPYLDACIKESMRLHPAPGLPLERVTPPSGVEILGQHIPGGTIVGCSAWVVHKRPEIFGSDVDSFRPERWLEADKEQLKEMNAAMLQFGSGARTCIGKNISLLEMYKLVPAFLRRFDVDFAIADERENHWVLHNAWFVKQRNFLTRFTAKRIA